LLLWKTPQRESFFLFCAAAKKQSNEKIRVDTLLLNFNGI